MEKRVKVICHMMTTIDGKISIDWDGNADYDYCGDYYDNWVFSYGEAYGCGRATFQEDIEIDMARYAGREVKYEDKIILPTNGQFLCVAFDRYGKLRWEDNLMRYAGHTSLILEVLTKQVQPEFLAYLDELNIPYMFAGDKEFEPETFLRKLNEDYNVSTFALCGGAEINAEFIRRDLVDELSIVIGPAVDGSRETLSIVGSQQTTAFPKYFSLIGVDTIGHDGLHLKYAKK